MTGKFYPNGYSSHPSGNVSLSREYVSIATQHSQLLANIQHSEQILVNQLESPDPNSPLSDPSSSPSLYSWLHIIQNILAILNLTMPTLKPMTCYLCASLARPLLAAVSLNITNYTFLTSGISISPITNVPLWEPEKDNISFPLHACILPNSLTNVTLGRGNCAYNQTISTTSYSRPGDFLWCNGTLLNQILPNQSDPCFLVTIVPQLTLYSSSKVQWLLPHSRTH